MQSSCPHRAASTRGRQLRLSLALSLAGIVLIGGTRDLQNAVANGDTRSLTIYHTHTKETATITFRRNGSYDREGLDKLNWILRDWRRDEPTNMDPRLFDVVWEAQRESGSNEAVHIVSAYRSPETNGMLRRRSSAVAKNSQHMLGKAMDFFLPDVSIDKVRAIGMRLQRGGVGYYPTSFNPFVHLDVGSVRSWPRMTHDQLARLFPDGKTVHLPADGTPLPGYELAKAEIMSRGGSVAGSAYAEAGEGAVATGPRKSLWATLFGGRDEEEDSAIAPPSAPGRGGRGSRTAARGGSAGGQVVAAAAPAPAVGGDDAGARTFFVNDGRAPAAEAPLPAASSRRGPASRATAVAALAEPAAPTAAGPAAAPAAAPAQAAAEPAAAAPGPANVAQAGAGNPAPMPASPPSVQLAQVPMPPKRPDDLAASFTLANAPLPPARPLEAASLVPLKAVSGAGSDAAAPIPTDASAALAALSAAASAQSTTLATTLAPTPASTVLAYAPANHPAPPARPVLASTTGSASQGSLASQANPANKPMVVASLERIASVHDTNPAYAGDYPMRALFAKAATKMVPTAEARVSTARTRAANVDTTEVPKTPDVVLATGGFAKSASVSSFNTDRFGSLPTGGGIGSGFGFGLH